MPSMSLKYLCLQKVNIPGILALLNYKDVFNGILQCTIKGFWACTEIVIMDVWHVRHTHFYIFRFDQVLYSMFVLIWGVDSHWFNANQLITIPNPGNMVFACTIFATFITMVHLDVVLDSLHQQSQWVLHYKNVSYLYSYATVYKLYW